MNNLSLYALIFATGVLQAFGPPMNGQLRAGLINPWLTSLVSFGVIVLAFAAAYAIAPLPSPSAASVARMPWWSSLGGLIGAFAVLAGLMLIDKVGAGTLAGLTIGANLLTSLIIDHYGLLRMPVHQATPMRVLGAALMLGGMFIITKF